MVFLTNGHYMEHYNDVIVPYRCPDGLLIQKLENGYYLYDNIMMYDTKLPQVRETANGEIVCYPACNRVGTYEKSSVFFLLITVTQNTNHYTINLKKDEYIVGNRILSKIHIARYANYDNTVWKWFDIEKPYCVHLMDNKMCSFKVAPTQYIQLEKRTYVVNHVQQGETKVSPLPPS
jgi:hypothetical protein